MRMPPREAAERLLEKLRKFITTELDERSGRYSLLSSLRA
jgi:hypothetical protein